MKNIYSFVALLLLISFGANAQTRIYTPTLRAPVNEATGQMPDVLLDWDAVTGQGTVITYEVQLAQQVDFSDAITFPETTVTAMNMSLLNFDEFYFWRVRASDGITTSDWSAPFSFRVIPTVAITSPNNNSTQNPDPLIKWNIITGISNYDIQVDTVPSWSPQPSGVDVQLNDVFQIDQNHAWAVGNGGTIVQFLDGSWTTVESGTTENLLDVYFVGNDHGWAVGAAGVILHYNGTTWATMESGTSSNLNGLYFTSTTNGYAVGNGGTALNYNGAEWTAISTGITADIFAIHGLNENMIWATGKSGAVAYFDGASWTNSTITNRDLLGVWAVSADNVWATAKNGRIFYYNGTDWVEQTSGSTRDLNDACFLDENNGFVVGNNGTLLYYNGSIWQTLASGTTQNLFGINLVDAESGFFVGNTGIIVSYQGDGFNSDYLKSFSTAQATSEFQFQNLAFGKNHYFRMRARHDESTSDWSTARLFTVVASPTLATPANNATNIALDTLVKWNALSGVVGYTVQRATTADFADPFTFESPVPEYRFQGLLFGQDYYWRVNARHAGGVSAWSTASKFTTASTVTLTSPANNAVDVIRLPNVTWQAIRGTQKYLVQFCKNSNFDCPEDHLTTENNWQTVFLLDPETAYYWRVRAIQGLDSTAWSPTWSFTTVGETAIGEQELQALQIYPNPGKGMFTIELTTATKEIEMELYSITGKSLYQQKLEVTMNTNKTEIDLREYGRGVYMLRLRSGNEIVTRKLIIE
jgi:photosystem II stability/assembly factor-like uncharacterized protein